MARIWYLFLILNAISRNSKPSIPLPFSFPKLYVLCGKVDKEVRLNESLVFFFVFSCWLGCYLYLFPDCVTHASVSTIFFNSVGILISWNSKCNHMFFLSYQLCTYYLNVIHIFNLAYHTRDIISRGLYILGPLFEGQFNLSKGLLW